MRLTYAVAFVVGGIALYFALLWGADAVHTLSSPSFGLRDETFARIIFSLSQVLHLGERGPLLLAAALAALKLAVAGIFLIHIGDRLYSLLGHKHEPEYLDAALMLVVVATMAAALPALIEGASHLIRQHTLHLLLAGVAASLSVFERIAEKEEQSRVKQLENEAGHTAADVIAVMPARRGNVSAMRWDLLRKQAGLRAMGVSAGEIQIQRARPDRADNRATPASEIFPKRNEFWMPRLGVWRI